MCYAYGSLDHAIKVCPMCKVFRPSSSRCPHFKDVCYNRTLHPKHDVIFLKNAEVQSFNGCGFCRWARMNPSPKTSGYANPGWPGCCRPPTPSEQAMIQAADWPTVSIVHQVPIPPAIKALLDSLNVKAPSAPSATRGSSGQATVSSSERRSSNASPSNKATLTLGKPPSIAVPTKRRSSVSPQPPASSLCGNSSRDSGDNASSLPNSSAIDQVKGMRRQNHTDHLEKSHESPHSSHSSPAKKHIDLESSLSRRNSGARPTVTAVTQMLAGTTLTADNNPHESTLRRRGSVSGVNLASARLTPPGSRTIDRGVSTLTLRTQVKRPECDISSASSSSSSSSDGMGSATDTDCTVISDGFTDYLSDESEAELQRQAEARAALVAQNQAEEQEFRAARQQLAHVDLRPPKSWNASRYPTSSPHIPAYSADNTPYVR